MCAVSMITDHFRDKWPLDRPLVNPDVITITKKEWLEYQELKRRMEEYDKQTGQPDCVKPEVDPWEKKVEDILRKRGLI